jgi:uncharacterized membrane protein YfcA
LILTLFLISMVGGLLSGLLGLGGAVVLIPLMLAVPPLAGVGVLTMKEVAGITMLQVLASSITGCLTHHKGGYVHRPSLLAIGAPMAVCSLAGGYCSRYMSGELMLWIFVALVVAAFLILLRREDEARGEQADAVDYHPVRFAAVGAFVGFAAGTVGAGGGFILVPLMISVLKIPVRTTVGTSLGIIFIGAVMGSIGKILSLQVQWNYVLPAVLGSIPAARLGAHLSRRIPARWIRLLLLGVVFLTLVKTLWDLLGPG